MTQPSAPRWGWVLPLLTQIGGGLICLAIADMVLGGVISRGIHRVLFGF